MRLAGARAGGVVSSLCVLFNYILLRGFSPAPSRRGLLCITNTHENQNHISKRTCRDWSLTFEGRGLFAEAEFGLFELLLAFLLCFLCSSAVLHSLVLLRDARGRRRLRLLLWFGFSQVCDAQVLAALPLFRELQAEFALLHEEFADVFGGSLPPLVLHEALRDAHMTLHCHSCVAVECDQRMFSWDSQVLP